MQRPTENFPAPPSDWTSLTKDQLTYIHHLLEKGISLPEYKLRIFLYLMGLRIVKRADKKEDGSFIYHFKKRGWSSYFSRKEYGMEAWEVDYWIEQYLKFLDEPFHLWQLPFEYIKVGRIYYKAPEAMMVNLTYEQYGNAQRCLIAYWETSKMVESLKKNGTTRAAVRHAQDEALRARAGFMAHLYTAPSLRLLDQRGQMTRVSLDKVYTYCSVEAEKHIKRFMRAPSWLFAVSYQLFQTCQALYKKDFPFLFKEYKDNEDKSALVMEIGTINAVQKYAGFTDPQSVYDQNSMFIFKFLDSMAEEAKQIEDMNRKMKLNSH